MKLQEAIEVIPGYRLEAKLGQGQFGEVWRATSPGGAQLALKFLDLSAKHGWKEFRSIQRVKQIRHAHLMPIVALWLLDDDGQILTNEEVADLATRETSRSESDTLVVNSLTSSTGAVHLVVATLLGDQTLGDRLKECRDDGNTGIPAKELLSYMAEAAKGIDFLNSAQHAQGGSQVGVQHCDIKPDNIMLTGGSVVICDLGVTQILAEARQDATATSLGGSPAYMPPELFENKPSRASDQYSLAVTYHELRTGELPFKSQKYFDVVDAHRNGTLDLSRLPELEQAVIRKATSTLPSARYATASEMVEDLRRAAVESLATSVATRSSPSVRNLALAAGLVAAAVAAWAWWDRPVPSPLPPDNGGQTGQTGNGGESNGGEVAPPPLRQVEIVLDPADAQVTINGTAYPPNAAGRIEVEIAVDAPLRIVAHRLPDYLEEEFTIAPEQLELSPSQKLTLRPSAAFHVRRAEELLAADQDEDAVAEYAQAIQLDPAMYGRLPPPIVHETGVENLRWLRAVGDEELLVTCGRDRAVRRWRFGPAALEDAGELFQSERSVWSLTAREGWIAAGDTEGTAWLSNGSGDAIRLDLFDAADDRSNAGVVEVAIADHGHFLVAATHAPEGGEVALFTWDLRESDIRGSRRQLGDGQPGEMPMLAAAHHSPWIAVSTFDDRGIVQRWTVPDGRRMPIGEQKEDVHALAISPDDRFVVYGGAGPPLINGIPATARGRHQATVVDTLDGKPRTLAPGHKDVIEVAAFDAESGALVTGCADGEAQYWPLPISTSSAERPGRRRLQLLQDGHDGPINAIACNAAIGVVVTVGQDCCAVIWDVTSDNPLPIALESSETSIVSAMFRSGGRQLILAGKSGSIRVYDVRYLMMVKRACERSDITPKRQAADQEDPVT